MKSDLASRHNNNPLDALMGYHLRRAANAMLDDLRKRIEPLGLTVTEMSVLQLVAATPQICQSEIGQLLTIKRANMAPLIAKLETRGWIQREAIDGRSQGLTLTVSGQAILIDLKVCIAENERWILRNAPHQDPAALITTLKSIWATKA